MAVAVVRSPLAFLALFVAVGAALAWLFWAYLVGAGVLWLAWRMLRRDLGHRPRPKSSWSSLGRTVSIMYAAWNSRWLKPGRGPNFKMSMPAKVDGPKVDEDGIPY